MQNSARQYISNNITQPGTQHIHSKDRTDISDNRTNCLTVVYITLLLQAPNNAKEIFSPVNKTQLLKKKKLHGLSPRANYTDRAAAAGRRS
jgi:hypothetical protein